MTSRGLKKRLRESRKWPPIRSCRAGKTESVQRQDTGPRANKLFLERKSQRALPARKMAGELRVSGVISAPDCRRLARLQSQRTHSNGIRPGSNAPRGDGNRGELII